MRIPISQGDWPHAFNKVSKYIGRHWPLGKLKLNESREITAHLFGYSSLHDLYQELNSFKNKEVRVVDMVNSMALRGLIKFKLPLDQSLNLFHKLPWKDLSVWLNTSDYAAEVFRLEAERQGKLLIIDEGYDFFVKNYNYKTSDIVINCIKNGKIPRYKYVVDKKGMIFRSDYFESLLSRFDITEDKIRDLGFNIKWTILLNHIFYR